jgi:predicted oxidoreductase
MKVQLHPGGPKLSRITAGMMRLHDWQFSVDELHRWIQQCVDLGVTTFDHADIYGGYTVEKLFGDALAKEPGLRRKLELVTKCGIGLVNENRPENTIKHYNTSYDYIISSAELSLKNFRTDVIDLFLIHRPSPLMNASETARALSDLVKSGKVLNVGVSNFSPSQFDLLQSCLDIPLVTNQVEFSVLHTQPVYDGTFDHAQKLNFFPMVWSPFGGGSVFSGNDEQSVRILKTCSELYEKYQCAIDQLQLAWVMHHPSKPVPVTGSGNISRIEGAVGALDIELNDQDWFAILKSSQNQDVP